MNTELLLKVRSIISSDPESFDMFYIGTRNGKKVGGIVSHTILASGINTNDLAFGGMTIDQVASNLLGLSEESSRNLFDIQNWPMSSQLRFFNSLSVDKGAAEACLVIDRFMGGFVSLNIELLEKVKVKIQNHPELLNMSEWYSYDKCVPVACIAGHCVLESGLDPNSYHMYETTFYKAMNLLDINHEQASSLFCISCWPEKNADKYLSAQDLIGYAEAVVERIDSFISSGGDN